MLTDRPMLDRLFAAFEAKDLPTILGFFADDAVMIDPHYPTPRMEGKAAIADGLTWAFNAIEQPGFSITNVFATPSGQHLAVEVATVHRFRGGMQVEFPQVFAVETRWGRITRLQAYTPYGPHGIGGGLLVLTRLLRRFRHKSSNRR